MTTVFGLSPEIWAALSAIGTLFAAVGTFLAVHVALRSARREKPTLNVKVSVLHVAQSDVKGFKVGDPFISIKATNVGHRPATVQGVYWKFGASMLRLQTYVLTPKLNPGSSRLPHELHHGQQVQLFVPMEEFRPLIAEIVESLASKRLATSSYFKHIRCGFFCTIDSFDTEVDGSVREIIEDELSQWEKD